MKTIEQILGNRIKALRKMAGLTQTHLADACGVTKLSVGRIESGESWPRLETLHAIAGALETTPVEIFKSALLAGEDALGALAEKIDIQAARIRELEAELEKAFENPDAFELKKMTEDRDLWQFRFETLAKSVEEDAQFELDRMIDEAAEEKKKKLKASKKSELA